MYITRLRGRSPDRYQSQNGPARSQSRSPSRYTFGDPNSRPPTGQSLAGSLRQTLDMINSKLDELKCSTQKSPLGYKSPPSSQDRGRPIQKLNGSPHPCSLSPLNPNRNSHLNCHNCGEPDHFARDCPRNSNRVSFKGVEKAPGYGDLN